MDSRFRGNDSRGLRGNDGITWGPTALVLPPAPGDFSRMDISPPPSPRLFLIDGYALIYRAFFALISRPLTTSRGENTSAAWGIVNFLQRLIEQHKPEYLGWVLDSGLSFRHTRYPAYKATREKLGEELQADFDRGMERIGEILSAYNVPVLSLEGFEADDVIGTLARRGAEQGVNVVVVSGDKDFYQLIAPKIFLLNPGRGGPASVDEKWVGVENASERLGVPPEYVTDYLALVGDSSDNVPGVRGIGDKTACELVEMYGPLEEILAHVDDIKKKRPREALQEHEADARLSKELVTLRYDLPVELDLDELTVREPDHARLKEIFVELEFHGLARDHAAEEPKKEEQAVKYTTVDTIEALKRMVKRARSAPHIAVDTETIIDPGSPQIVDPLRCTIVSISIAVAPGEAYYLPLRHRAQLAEQGDLLVDVAGDRSPTDAPEDRGLVMGGDEIDGRKSSTAKSKTAKKKSAKQSTEPGSIAARALANGGVPGRNLPPRWSRCAPCSRTHR